MRLSHRLKYAALVLGEIGIIGHRLRGKQPADPRVAFTSRDMGKDLYARAAKSGGDPRQLNALPFVGVPEGYRKWVESTIVRDRRLTSVIRRRDR